MPCYVVPSSWPRLSCCCYLWYPPASCHSMSRRGGDRTRRARDEGHEMRHTPRVQHGSMVHGAQERARASPLSVLRDKGHELGTAYPGMTEPSCSATSVLQELPSWSRAGGKRGDATQVLVDKRCARRAGQLVSWSEEMRRG